MDYLPLEQTGISNYNKPLLALKLRNLCQISMLIIFPVSSENNLYFKQSVLLLLRARTLYTRVRFNPTTN